MTATKKEKRQKNESKNIPKTTKTPTKTTKLHKKRNRGNIQKTNLPLLNQRDKRKWKKKHT